MKKLITIIVLIFGIQKLIACCAGGIISILPKSNMISQNAVILIDFMERDYRIYEKLSDATFYLIDDKGKKIELEILERNRGFHTMAQILLKPNDHLKLGENVSIQINGIKAENKNQERFLQYVQSKKWKVKFEKDEIAPKFSEAISYKIVDHSNSSAPGFGIRGKVMSWDNYDYSYERNNSLRSQVLIEAINQQGDRYLLIANAGSFSIYEGICGAEFEVNYDAEYTYMLRVIDFSGNKSEETKEVSFIVPSQK